LQSLCPTPQERRRPNEDFGGPSKELRLCFWSTFQGCDHLIWATTHLNPFKNTDASLCSALQNLRLVSIKLLQKIVTSHKNLVSWTSDCRVSEQ
jgi:hypothetical protein